MFGVDSEGRDTLSPQFSRGPKSSERAIKPGSSLDLQMLTVSNVRSMSKSPVVRKKALDYALKSLKEKGILDLDEEALARTRTEIIDRKFQEYLRDLEADKKLKLGFQSSIASKIEGDSLLVDSKLDDEMAAYAKKKYKERLEKKIAIDHPGLIAKVLRKTYKAGEYSKYEDRIQHEIECFIAEKAVEVAYKAAQEAAVSASRNAVLSMAAA